MSTTAPGVPLSYTIGFSSPHGSMYQRPAPSAHRIPWQRHPGTLAVAVVALHAFALWALQTGLLRRAVETVVPAQILVELWNPQPQPPAPPAPAAKAVAPQLAKPTPPATTLPVPPAPAPVPIPVPAATSTAAAAVTTSTSVAINSVAVDASSTRASSQNSGESRVAAPAPATAPKIELPSSDADYLNNPKPPYPALSKRMGEQGKVVVRTLIGTDGHAQEVQLAQSSGFDRLDQAALHAARQWRYVPGKRDGVPQAMWFNVPFTFQLQ